MSEKKIIGYRKWMFALIYGGIILAIASILNFLSKPIDDNFVKIAMIVYLGYLGVNMGSKIATAMGQMGKFFKRKPKEESVEDEEEG